MTSTSVSLLDRLRHEPDEQAWESLVELYSPLIRAYLARYINIPDDSDDLLQNVLIFFSRKLRDFEHNQRTGAFRNWLRMITVNTVREFWRARRVQPVGTGDNDFQNLLAQLEDPHSDASRRWNQEHDEYVTARLLKVIRRDFEEQTWQAFERLTLNEVPAAQVASELGMTPNAVYIAKSRVLARLRREAKGLID